jgi:hypothetical protein
MLIPYSSPSWPSFTACMRLPRLTPSYNPPAAQLSSMRDAHRGQRSCPALSPPPRGTTPAHPVAGSHAVAHRWSHRRSMGPRRLPAGIPPPCHSTASSFASMSLHSSNQQVDATLKAHVTRVCFKCLRCFRGMLQVLYIDVAKVDRDIAHVLMAIHVCFKCMLQMLHLFQTYVASVLSRCCKSRFGCCIYMHVVSICFRCFIRMLQEFHLDAADVCNDFQVFSCVFASISDDCFKCFIYLLLYVVTIASGCFKCRSCVAHGMRVGSG